MPQSTLYWIIAAIIVVLLILIILSVIASRRRREAEAEAAETRLERRGTTADTADTAGEQAAAPAAPTRLSRLDEVVAEKDARPAAAVKPAGGMAAFDTAAAVVSCSSRSREMCASSSACQALSPSRYSNTPS